MATRSTTAPAVPTRLLDVELAAPRHRPATLAAVVAAGPEPDRPVFGPGAESVPEQWPSIAEVTGRAGEVRPGPAGMTPRWLVGVGQRRPVDWRGAGAALPRAVREAAEASRTDPPRTVDLRLPDDIDPTELGDLVLGLVLGGYRFRVTGQHATPSVGSVRLAVRRPTEELRTALRRALVLASATGFARDLANMPSNIKNPAWLAATASRVLGNTPGLTVTVHEPKWLVEQGFGGVLAVGGGSASPPRLVELAWRPPAGGRVPHVALVGKGITFDTGGMSLKKADGMHLMRTDMSGAGAVLAALRAIAELRLPVRVTAFTPLAENHVSGSAYRPGDVIRHHGGTTTEVTNTDAEGRLVLADALAYAARRHRPDLLVDVATLTGAMKVSLGVRTGGVFATSDELAERVGAAGEAVGEAWWRMPLLADHVDAVRGEIADVRQAPPGPGGVMAALFLREFTAGLPWAHLDIAGPARADKAYAEVVAGGTGFAARTLVAIVESLVE